MEICVAILSKGTQCQKVRKAVGDGTRCGLHHKCVLKYGPNTYARRELGYIHKKEILDFVQAHRIRVGAAIAIEAGNDDIANIQLNYLADIRVMQARHRRVAADLLLEQRNQVRDTGVDPDREARERQIADNQRNREAWNRRMALAQNLMMNRRQLDLFPAPPPLVGRRLEALANDPQNVHTTEAVRQTKDIVERVRKVPVPEGYRWNTHVVSKTIGEIIVECELSAHAAAQMFNQYVSNVSVYDIEEGIYGKVLDSVWQYIKSSPDKEDLCKILKNEMTDNIGMCAQGNLSRICNILAGYMDGVGAQESLSELLGRLLPPLMAIEDVSERIRLACVILAENKVPISEWDTWMEPFLEEDFTDFYQIIREQFEVV